jgi:acetoacetyl-CoA synthetase
LQQPLWQPSEERTRGSNITALIEAVEEDWNVNIGDFDGLYEFSITEIDKFWVSLKDFGNIIAETWGERVQENPGRMPGTRFFPDARLNFAENLLRRRDTGEAIVFRGEDKVSRTLSYAELYDQVSVLRQALMAMGVVSGDRVGAYLPNMPEAIIAMLAATSLGASWSSCSPDFGVKGVLDRFGQIEPKVIFAAEGYYYNGKSHDCLEKLAAIVSALPSVEKTVLVSYTREAPSLEDVPGGIWLADFTAPFEAADIDFERFAFNHPLYIMYSSGTTGAPKCIVHGAGGSLLKHITEHQLHCDIKPGDRVFYFTTCGWMMWNWLVTALASQATLILYDGSPFYPDGNVMFDFIDAEKITLFGTSAKFIDAVIKAGLEPAKSHSLESVRLICSTGSPLAPDAFDWVYEHLKGDVHLASIAGGTDLMGCFMLGNPTGPVWKGEIQARALGMAVDVFDDDGNSIRGQKGELVCTKPFPSMPIGFYKDDDGSKYHSAYFERFDNVWCHGDYVELTQHGGIIVYGRSDATLNPGGVRIGTAEIYRQVEKLPQVVEAIVIGQQWEYDVRVVLFVTLREGLKMDEDLAKLIRSEIRDNCTLRHVPAKVIQVPDIPRTKSGKITELAVRDVIHGRAVKNKEALANPEALELFRDLTELQD